MEQSLVALIWYLELSRAVYTEATVNEVLHQLNQFVVYIVSIYHNVT